MAKRGSLLDLNALIALTDDRHPHHGLVTEWFVSGGGVDWGRCLLTEAGFVRITANPKGGRHSINQANDVLRLLSKHSGHRYWPIRSDWASLTAPLKARMFGHQQVTDACLLGLALEEDGLLVTMDKGLRFLAGKEYGRNVLVLE